jgi:4-hydroxyphenylacetate decarboxylase small subunit
MEELTCKDCKYYLPVDVFGGLCKLSKEKITPDTPFCGKAERIAKCRFCTNYTAEKDYLGKCMGTALAYPDMIAVKCADFQWYRKS